MKTIPLNIRLDEHHSEPASDSIFHFIGLNGGRRRKASEPGLNIAYTHGIHPRTLAKGNEARRATLHRRARAQAWKQAAITLAQLAAQAEAYAILTGSLAPGQLSCRHPLSTKPNPTAPAPT